MVVVVVVLCCAFEENDEFFSKVPLLNPNRESKSKRSFGLSLKRRVHKTFFLRHFFRKEKVKTKRLKSRSLFLSFQRCKRPVNDVNDGKQREQIRERACVRVRESACETKRGGKREERREN